MTTSKQQEGFRRFDNPPPLRVAQDRCVDLYWGDEIPYSQQLGLDPDKVYHLLRDRYEPKRLPALDEAASHSLVVGMRPGTYNGERYDGVILDLRKTGLES